MGVDALQPSARGPCPTLLVGVGPPLSYLGPAVANRTPATINAWFWPYGQLHRRRSRIRFTTETETRRLGVYSG
jgi:hypothetical protein